MDFTEEDLGWIAGFIDGEGCITIGSQTGYNTLLLQVVNSKLDILQGLQAFFGVGSIHKHSSANLQLWNWAVTSRGATMILKRLLPYFRAKNEEASLALDFRKLMESEPVRIGKPLPEETIAQRAAYFWALRVIKKPDRIL